MLSALDPLGLPVATQIVSGERADDLLYIPAIEQVSQSLHEHGLLYVGDCKMAALETRAFVQAQQDYYLCPLASKHLPEAVLAAYWLAEGDDRRTGGRTLGTCLWKPLCGSTG
jgi:transposase